MIINACDRMRYLAYDKKWQIYINIDSKFDTQEVRMLLKLKDIKFDGNLGKD
jgi:hypothetical protein